MTDSTKTIYHPRPWADSILFRSLHCREDSQDTKYENMQNEPNPASTNERQETRDKRRINMQNEPNFNLLIHSFTHSLINTIMQNEPNCNLLIHSFTHSLINTVMQNKPNFNPTTSWPTSPNGPRVTRDESRFMQNEPNFNPSVYYE